MQWCILHRLRLTFDMQLLTSTTSMYHNWLMKATNLMNSGVGMLVIVIPMCSTGRPVKQALLVSHQIGMHTFCNLHTDAPGISGAGRAPGSCV